MATHSGILAWRIPSTEEPGGLQSRGSQRVGHDWSDWAHTQTAQAKLFSAEARRSTWLWRRQWKCTPSLSVPTAIPAIPIFSVLLYALGPHQRASCLPASGWSHSAGTPAGEWGKKENRMENLFTWFPLCRTAAPSLSLDQRSRRSLCLQTPVLPPLASSDIEHSSSRCSPPQGTCTVPRDFLTSCQHLCKQSS